MLSIQMKSKRLAKRWTCVLWLLTVSKSCCLSFLHLNWEAACWQSFSGYFVLAVFMCFFLRLLTSLNGRLSPQTLPGSFTEKHKEVLEKIRRNIAADIGAVFLSSTSIP